MSLKKRLLIVGGGIVVGVIANRLWLAVVERVTWDDEN